MGKKKKIGIAPNVKNAAAVMGYTEEMLREATAEGCRALKQNGKFDCDEFHAWILTRKVFLDRWTEKGEIPDRAQSIRVKAHYDAMDAKRKYEEKMKVLIRKDKFAIVVQDVSEKQRAILKDSISEEVLDRICEQMQPLFDACQ